MELEAKHLVPYLPYELKFGSGNQKYYEFVLSGIDFYTRTDIQIRTRGNRIYKISDIRVKPLLRPLSDLTKEIEVNGEKFVPVKKIHEKGEKWHSEPIVSHHIKKVYLTKGYDHIPHWMFQDLIKWHFDVFGLIDQGLALPLI